MAQVHLSFPPTSGTPTAIERRAGERIPCQLETLCRPCAEDAEASPWLTTVEDISENGVGLAAPCAVPPGTELLVELPSASRGEPQQIRVRVVRVAPRDQGGVLLGCEFACGLTEAERADIDQIVMETWRTLPLAPSLAPRGASLVHIYPTGQGAATRHILGKDSVIVGRGDTCDICIPDHSVSRRHARIDLTVGGYRIEDLRSTNGVAVNNTRVSVSGLADGDTVRLGGSIFRFLAGDNIETHYHDEIRRLTIQDPLTGAFNKRYLLQCLQRELARAARYRRPLAVLLIDLDHFKHVNDQFGHMAGDFTLVELVRRLRTEIRSEEVLARFGGEEFAVVLPETSGERAATVAERLRACVAGQPLNYEGTSFMVTISAGVASTEGDRPLTPAALLELADQHLYAAKHQGRNRVVA